ncbi:hypothetical protein N1851_024069 [Merluccius polli]|uniref:Uncharacterized protein n=1 Tax=Merluccius polli TaxID=89951 RepID=A0AA47MFE9_MERPO|nr:hypothetical protein N1851_024069 [Merluccius polli]
MREKSTEFKCGKCGGSHKPKSCPAYGKTCHNCGKDNHFSKCCNAMSTKKKVYTELDFVVDSVETCSTDRTEWVVPIEVNETIIPFKLDTGAQVNLLSMEDYKTLTVKSKINPVKIKVTGYTGETVPVKGSCIATFKSRRQIKSQLLIMDKRVQPILGLSACEKLNLVKKVFVVMSPEASNDSD